MVDNAVWEICERVVEVQARFDDRSYRRHTAADLVAKTCPSSSCCGRCTMSATSRRICLHA